MSVWKIAVRIWSGIGQKETLEPMNAKQYGQAYPERPKQYAQNKFMSWIQIVQPYQSDDSQSVEKHDMIRCVDCHPLPRECKNMKSANDPMQVQFIS